MCRIRIVRAHSESDYRRLANWRREAAASRPLVSYLVSQGTRNAVLDLLLAALKRRSCSQALNALSVL